MPNTPSTCATSPVPRAGHMVRGHRQVRGQGQPTPQGQRVQPAVGQCLPSRGELWRCVVL